MLWLFLFQIQTIPQTRPKVPGQGHYADRRELSKWSWRLLFMSPLVIGCSVTNLKTCSVLQIFIFPPRLSLDLDSKKPPVPRKLLFTGPSSHGIRAPLIRELGPLQMGDHDCRWEDSSSERISAVLFAKTPWTKTLHRFDGRHGLGGGKESTGTTNK